MKLTCFKAYDIRGKLGDELNKNIAYCIGRAYAQHLNAQHVVVGGDVRLTSSTLKLALANGLMDGGADVVNIGMVGTKEIYFAAFYLDVDGGIEVTASHNHVDYNGRSSTIYADLEHGGGGQTGGWGAIQSKTGHAFIKEHMRTENTIYGGEMSAHHYFRDFAYCDSGMILWVLNVVHRQMELLKKVIFFSVSALTNVSAFRE